MRKSKLLLLLFVIGALLTSCTNLNDDLGVSPTSNLDSSLQLQTIPFIKTGIFFDVYDTISFELRIGKLKPYLFYLSNEFNVIGMSARIYYIDTNMQEIAPQTLYYTHFSQHKQRVLLPKTGDYRVVLQNYNSENINKLFKLIVETDTGSQLLADSNETYPRQDTTSIMRFSELERTIHYGEDKDIFSFMAYSSDSITVNINTLFTSSNCRLKFEVYENSTSIFSSSDNLYDVNYRKLRMYVKANTNYYIVIYPYWRDTYIQFRYGIAITD